jgi:hypothetical protein
MYRTLGCAVVGCLISGFVTKRTTRIKYLIFIVFPVDIKTIYAEFIRIYLRARRCQKACAFPGGLVVDGSPQSVANRDRRRRTKSQFAIGLREQWMRLVRTIFTRCETFLEVVVACR